MLHFAMVWLIVSICLIPLSMVTLRNRKRMAVLVQRAEEDDVKSALLVGDELHTVERLAHRLQWQQTRGCDSYVWGRLAPETQKLLPDAIKAAGYCDLKPLLLRDLNQIILGQEEIASKMVGAECPLPPEVEVQAGLGLQGADLAHLNRTVLDIAYSDAIASHALRDRVGDGGQDGGAGESTAAAQPAETAPETEADKALKAAREAEEKALKAAREKEWRKSVGLMVMGSVLSALWPLLVVVNSFLIGESVAYLFPPSSPWFMLDVLGSEQPIYLTHAIGLLVCVGQAATAASWLVYKSFVWDCRRRRKDTPETSETGEEREANMIANVNAIAAVVLILFEIGVSAARGAAMGGLTNALVSGGAAAGSAIADAAVGAIVVFSALVPLAGRLRNLVLKLFPRKPLRSRADRIRP
jgi:hypothetical protein